MMQLIFRPEDVEPERSDFRILRTNTEPMTEALTFTTWDQIVRHLVENKWPKGGHPWVHDGTKIVDPDTVRRYLPD